MASNCWLESRFDCCAISACAIDDLHTFVFVYNFCNRSSYSPAILMLKPGSLMQTGRLGDMISLLE